MNNASVMNAEAYIMQKQVHYVSNITQNMLFKNNISNNNTHLMCDTYCGM